MLTQWMRLFRIAIAIAIGIEIQPQVNNLTSCLEKAADFGTFADAEITIAIGIEIEIDSDSDLDFVHLAN
jgi:hypothetical protein